MKNKKDPKPQQRYASHYRISVSRINKKRRDKMREERRREQLVLELLELQFAREISAIEYSKKNEHQALNWSV